MGVAIALSCVIGLVMIYWVKGKAVNFFVAGRTLPLYVVIFALATSSIDSNALLGNANLSYKYQFWDGAVLPVGLGLSLILNGMNNVQVLLISVRVCMNNSSLVTLIV